MTCSARPQPPARCRPPAPPVARGGSDMAALLFVAAVVILAISTPARAVLHLVDPRHGESRDRSGVRWPGQLVEGDRHSKLRSRNAGIEHGRRSWSFPGVPPR